MTITIGVARAHGTRFLFGHRYDKAIDFGFNAFGHGLYFWVEWHRC